jgi:hypothetical protein
LRVGTNVAEFAGANRNGNIAARQLNDLFAGRAA